MTDDRVEDVSDRIVEYSSALPHTLRTVPYESFGELFNQENVLNMNRTNLLDILNGNDFTVPEYQRLYSWDRENVEEFWEAVSRILEIGYVMDEESQTFVPSSPVADVFFGNFFLAEKENDDRMEVIDGQQRITTSMIFLSLIQDKLEEIECEDNDQLSNTKINAVNQIDDIILTSPDDQMVRNGGIIYSNDANDDLFYALVAGRDAKVEWLKDVEDYDGRKTDETVGSIADKLGVKEDLEEDDQEKYIYHPDSNQKMLSAYMFYSEKLDQVVEGKSPEESVRILINLKNFLLRSFTVGKVYIYPGSSPQLRMGIFQAINDRGKELSNTDKIRARVANLFSETEYEDEYTDKWEGIVKEFGTDDSDIQKFLKVYLTAYEDDLKTMSMASNRMMEAFALRDRQSYELEPRLQEIDKARELLDDLVEHVDPYLDLVNPDREIDLHEGRSEKFRKMVSRLNSMSTRQWRPLVLKAYADVDRDEEEHLIELIDTIEKLYLRLATSDLAANNLEETFPAVSHEINGDSLEEASEILVSQAEDDASVLFGDSFRDILMESKGIRRNDGRLLLTKLAEKEFRESNDGSIVDQDLTIKDADLEHTLPSSIIRNDGEVDKFVWLKNFFSGLDINHARMEELERHKDEDSLFEAMEELFINDIANMILLKDRDNRSIGNKQFSLKIEKYYDDELFNQVPVNNFFTSENDEFPEEKLEDISSNEEFWDGYWNVDTFLDRRKDLIERFLDLLELKKNEFNPNDSDQIAEDNRGEIESRLERLEVELH